MGCGRGVERLMWLVICEPIDQSRHFSAPDAVARVVVSAQNHGPRKKLVYKRLRNFEDDGFRVEEED